MVAELLVIPDKMVKFLMDDLAHVTLWSHQI